MNSASYQLVPASLANIDAPETSKAQITQFRYFNCSAWYI